MTDFLFGLTLATISAAVLLVWAATRLAAHLARREARRIAAAYAAGYDEGKAVAGRALNPIAYGRLGATR
ncbi:hypothetical protein [Nocardioides terrigena]|uniref:hypothetical protein n=1 Tax=Nocardioides terrigena TaxID=424797 RepID=UPI000D31C79A|nr:hypothetical protein [Nocardioides terrigena]